MLFVAFIDAQTQTFWGDEAVVVVTGRISMMKQAKC